MPPQQSDPNGFAAINMQPNLTDDQKINEAVGLSAIGGTALNNDVSNQPNTVSTSPPPIAPITVAEETALESQELQQAQAQIIKSQAAQQQAQFESETAIEEVKALEEETKRTQEELRVRAEASKQKLDSAQAKVQEADHLNTKTQEHLKSVVSDDTSSKGFGIKPMELLTVFSKPPTYGENDDTKTVVDSKEYHQVTDQLEKSKSAVKKSKKVLSEASKQLGNLGSTADQSKKKETEHFDNLSGISDKIKTDF
jgi:hypothetical protein